MVIWVLFTHIKNIFNGSIRTSPRPKYGEAPVAGGLAYSSDEASYIPMDYKKMIKNTNNDVKISL